MFVQYMYWLHVPDVFFITHVYSISSHCESANDVSNDAGADVMEDENENE